MNSLTIKNVTIALFLGALGSGLWSIAGEPFIKWFIEVFIEFAQFINSSFNDSLHENIGKSHRENNSLYLSTLVRVFFTMGIIVLPIFAYMTMKRVQKLKQADSESKKKEIDTEVSDLVSSTKKIFIISILLSIVGAPLYVSRIITSAYNNGAIVYVERSIEIVTPKIPNEHVLELRAQYRSVSNASDFYKLHEKLQEIAKLNSIELPEFSVAR